MYFSTLDAIFLIAPSDKLCSIVKLKICTVGELDVAARMYQPGCSFHICK